MSSHFDQYGAYLTTKTASAIDAAVDLDAVRGWLDDASVHASSDAVASWGHLITHLLQYLSKATFTDTIADDAQRLHAYLEAMRTLEPEVWWAQKYQGELAKSRRPCCDVYEAFENVCSQLNASGLHRTNPTLKNLVEKRSWNPTPLLTSLNAMKSQQLHYARLYVHRDHSLRGIAQGKLLQALRPLVLDTTWRPCDTPLYGDTWLVHDSSARNGNLDEAKRGREFVQRFARSTPSQTDKIVTFISFSKDISLQGIDSAVQLTK